MQYIFPLMIFQVFEKRIKTFKYFFFFKQNFCIFPALDLVKGFVIIRISSKPDIGTCFLPSLFYSKKFFQHTNLFWVKQGNKKRPWTVYARLTEQVDIFL